MAITAVHTKLLYMHRMGEGNGLIRLIAHASVFGGEIIPYPKCDGRTHNQHTDKELEREPIGPSREKVRHRVVFYARIEGNTSRHRVEIRGMMARILRQKNHLPL
jgi:hypothetical protein